MDRPRQQPGQSSGGIHPRSYARWLGKSGQRPGLSPSATVEMVSHGFPRLLVFWGSDSTYVNVYSYNALCSAEGQMDFWLRRPGSLLGFLVDSLITRDPTMKGHSVE
ncbi:hypothetical protein TNCV_322631 [Trichonephila clavipes]|nr:hypothetical protein TNCV_322631 [Trichonephila clavipes]